MLVHRLLETVSDGEYASISGGHTRASNDKNVHGVKEGMQVLWREFSDRRQFEMLYCLVMTRKRRVECKDDVYHFAYLMDLCYTGATTIVSACPSCLLGMSPALRRSQCQA